MSDGFNAFDQKIEAIAEDELSEERLLEMLDRVRMRKELDALDGQVRKQLKRIIEGLLFASSGPLSFRKIREVCDTLYPVRPKILLSMLTELRDEYRDQERAFQLEEIGKGFVLRTHESIGSYVEQLYRNKRTERLSAAATEVLAIIAYRQPVTRSQIDAIRGVDSSGTLQALVERELVEVVGRLEAPGRPSLYSVTEGFITYFGYKDLSELPRLGTDEELAEETKTQKDPSTTTSETESTVLEIKQETAVSKPAPENEAEVTTEEVDPAKAALEPATEPAEDLEQATALPQAAETDAQEEPIQKQPSQEETKEPTGEIAATGAAPEPVSTQKEAESPGHSSSPALWSQFSVGSD